MTDRSITFTLLSEPCPFPDTASQMMATGFFDLRFSFLFLLATGSPRNRGVRGENEVEGACFPSMLLACMGWFVCTPMDSATSRLSIGLLLSFAGSHSSFLPSFRQVMLTPLLWLDPGYFLSSCGPSLSFFLGFLNCRDDVCTPTHMARELAIFFTSFPSRQKRIFSFSLIFTEDERCSYILWF